MAGMLDSLNLGGGGLLEFLRSLQQQNSFSGLPSDQAQYGQPMDAMAQMPPQQPAQRGTPYGPFDNAQWPVGPMGAPSQAPQQPQQPQQPQPQMQMQAPQDGPGGFGAGLRGFVNNLHNGPIGAIVGGLGSAAGWQDPEQQRANQTAQYLVAKHGFDPAMAQSIVSDPATLRAILPSIMGVGGQTDDIKEYQFAKKEDPSLTFASFMQKKKSVSGEYGMTPIWGVKDGKPAILQLGKSGAAVQAGMPEGFELSRDPIKVEGPTGTSILDPQTRQVIQFIPKDVAGAAKAKEIGEAEGQATVNLPTAIATAENTLKTIDQLEKHPGKKSWGAFGLGAMLPDRPGSDVRGFAALLDQVKGQNFMTAFQSLKGAGAITETEGTKAEKAQARLDRAQSEKDFDTALKDLKDVVKAGMERARQKAGIKHGDASPTAKANSDLKQKYGLD